MSVTCSIPHCDGGDFADRVKLFRVPAVATGTSGLIFNLTEKRRKKWFNALSYYGLTPENCYSYRVCSAHFNSGKPAAIFDTKNPDWVPHKYLKPRAESNETLSDDESLLVPKSRRRNKKKKVNDENNVEESTENDEESQNDPEFVFVDIEKIKGGNLEKDAEESKEQKRPKRKMKNRTFGTQTNSSTTMQARSIASQTAKSKFAHDSIKDNSQASIGEIIEFIRKQVLEFNLKAFGNDFKIKECALLFNNQKEEPPKDKELSTVTILPNRLLSSNWPLLESVAMSLDLYRTHKKKEKISTAFARTVEGKVETITRIGNGDGNLLEKRKVHRKVQLNDSVDMAPQAAGSSISIGDVVKNLENKTFSNENRKLTAVNVPSADTVPKVPILIPPNKPVPIAKLDVETSENLKVLGTDKVPRVVLSKLSDPLEETSADAPNNDQSKPETTDLSSMLKKPGVSGYLLVPNNLNSADGPIVYVPTMKKGDNDSSVMSQKDLLDMMLKQGIPLKANIEKPNDTSISQKERLDKLLKEGLPTKKPKDENIDTTATIDSEMKCPYCAKRCVDGIEFVNHRRSGSCRSPVVIRCDKCQQPYRKDKQHYCRSAAPKRSPDCNVCGRVFLQTGHLANHLKSHENYHNLPEKCIECPKRFPTAEDLKAHILSWHPTPGPKKFACDLCGKRFATRAKLETHLVKTHDSDSVPMKIRCKICHDVFSLEHYRNVHWKKCEVKSLIESGIEFVDVFNSNDDSLSKKPTAIRSHSKDEIEKELSKIFNQDTSDSEYECEEILEEAKVIPAVKRKRFMNLDGDDEESNDEVPEVKKTKENEQNEIVTKVKEETDERSAVDITSLLSTAGLNDIIIEEIEDDPY